MDRKKQWMIYGMLTLATSTWGSAFIAGKIAIESFEPATISFLRFFGAAILLFPIMWLVEKNIPRITKRDWFLFALLGITGIAIYNICFFLASKHAPVIKSSLFIGANPMLIMLLSGLILKETITKRNVIGLLLAFAGVVTIVTEGDLSVIISFQFEPIDFILLGAVITWALYSVIGRIVLRKFSSIVSTTYAVGFGSLFLLPFSILEKPWESLATSTWSSWLAIAHMSVFVTVLGFILYYYGIQQIGAAKASIFINVMPVSAVIMATVFLGETLTIATMIGAVFVISGVYVGTSVKRTKRSTTVHAKIG
ncbi:DMT family transporter [Halalkalibacter akibai]|uniref:Permease of the drug/metabolite transporter n=1 Tax=Halalkalibacter akibai (strain ATCC 43226 / DSM 21942 / CIP 109018 / JCM 9157 / 1139) TaxID=1236973 RepID=W4QUG6_HALA3|nr:DMT family transporter [Halalkalibacter akibai]GAE35731.1 permease of the drug/metabolite transporter [Halalkalibacter akibai JCM 9157]